MNLIKARYHYNNLDKYVSLKQSELKRDLATNRKATNLMNSTNDSCNDYYFSLYQLVDRVVRETWRLAKKNFRC
jgi:hypothetical protein